MKTAKKSLAILLALSFIFSMFSFNVFADDAIESPVIPLGPTPEEWYLYELDTEAKTAVLIGMNPGPNRTKATVRSTYVKDEVEYAVVGVGKDAFKGTNIQSVEIQEGVLSIAEGAFADCASLNSVKVADSVVSINETAFDGSKWLESQPDGVIYLGKIAYKAKGTSEASVALKSDTVSIADGAFKNQTTLEKIFIPEATTIGDQAFAGCTAVTFYCYKDSPAADYAEYNLIRAVYIPALELKAAPTKLEYYQNDALVFNGMELIYFSEIGETLVEVTPEMVSGYDAATLGKQTVTITYNELSVTFDVTVVERPAFIPGDVDGNDTLELNDAIYLLYHINFPTNPSYAVNQPVDFDGDSQVTLNDAIYLLYHINFPDTYPLH